MKKLNLFLFFALVLSVTIAQAQVKKKAPVKRTMPAKAAPKPVVRDTFVMITTDYGEMVFKLYKETPLHRRNFIKLVESGFYDSLLFHRIIKGFMIQGGDPLSKYADSTDMLGNGDLGYKIPAEINKNIYHKRGALAAARDDNPTRASSSCQFYIVQGKVYKAEELSNAVNGMNYSNKMKILNDIMKLDTVKARFDDYVLRGDNEGRDRYLKQLQPAIDSEYAKLEYMPTNDAMYDYQTIGGTPHLDRSYTVFGELVKGMEVLDSIAAQSTNQFDRPYRDIRMKARLVYR